MRSLSSIFKDFMDPNLPADIISPWGAIKICREWVIIQRENFIAYTREVKAAQIAFQEGIQNAGIDQISRMTTKEVLDTFARPIPKAPNFKID